MNRVRLTAPLPALWRAPGVLQVGIDAGALVLEQVPRPLADAVRLLNRPRSEAELATLLPQLEPEWIGWLLHRLAEAGKLVHAEAKLAAVRIVGGATLAAEVAAAVAGVGQVQLHTAASFVSELDRSDPECGPDLVVLADGTCEPDRSLTDALARRGWTHLIVRTEPDRAVVGPLVVPGVTPCVRCLDLTRCRMDDGWPHLLAQLCLNRPTPDPILVRWAAATAMAQACAWLSGRLPETAAATVELALPDFHMGSRRWPAHPACGCLEPLT